MKTIAGQIKESATEYGQRAMANERFRYEIRSTSEYMGTITYRFKDGSELTVSHDTPVASTLARPRAENVSGLPDARNSKYDSER